MNYSTTITVEQSPEVVFAAITNVRGWWSEDIEGETDALGATFIFSVDELHRSTQQITEFVPWQKIVWHVVASHLSFVEDKTEWTGTDIIFEIGSHNNQTTLHFTHAGLVPAQECYNQCADTWSFIIKQSLFNLITQGKGAPFQAQSPKEAATVA